MAKIKSLVIMAVSVFIAFAFTFTFPPEYSEAQQLEDHLQCWSIRKDDLKLKGFVKPETANFGTDRCKIGRAILYCEPAVKPEDDPEQVFLDGREVITPDPDRVDAQLLTNGFICYKVMYCKNLKKQPVKLIDQFKMREAIIYGRAKLFCTPAIKIREPQ